MLVVFERWDGVVQTVPDRIEWCVGGIVYSSWLLVKLEGCEYVIAIIRCTCIMRNRHSENIQEPTWMKFSVVGKPEQHVVDDYLRKREVAEYLEPVWSFGPSCYFKLVWEKYSEAMINRRMTGNINSYITFDLEELSTYSKSRVLCNG